MEVITPLFMYIKNGKRFQRKAERQMKNKMLTNYEISDFTSQFSMILKAGINPVEGLGILNSDVKNQEGQRIIQAMLDDCKRGERFYHSMELTGVFPKYVLDMVRLGEETGKLDDVMVSLSLYYEKEQQTSDSIKSAITYPFAMIAMMLAVIIILISRVLPIFNQVFIQLGSEMNQFTKGLMNIGNLINRSSVVLIVLMVLAVLLFLFFTKVNAGKKLFAKLFASFFLTRNFASHLAAGRFASGMALTLESGLDTFHSLDMVSDLVDNKQMKQRIHECKEQVASGETFSDALKNAGIFTNLYNRMIGIGFKTGSLDQVMRKIAENYETETEKRIRSVISILEPTLVITLSVIVGMILLSVILPLMGIMASIG